MKSMKIVRTLFSMVGDAYEEVAEKTRPRKANFLKNAIIFDEQHTSDKNCINPEEILSFWRRWSGRYLSQ
jgi:hypothetical protein